MIYEEFLKGIAPLSCCGVQIDKTSLPVWYALLQDLPPIPFKIAVVELCKDVESFFPGSNIPAMIRERTRVIRVRFLDQERNSKILVEPMRTEKEKREAHAAFKKCFAKIKQMCAKPVKRPTKNTFTHVMQ